MTLSMTLTLTNDSLLLLGLVIVTLTCCLYGYCKGGGDAIEVQQQQYDGTADGAPNGVANGATDGATDEDKQDTVEDEARNTAAAVDETLNQDEEARDETSTNEETALDGTILAQQQYRVLYNLTHMWTIFRNPNPGMISLYQLIRNLYNMATWASTGLPIENNEEEEEDDDDEDEEYNAGYFERVSSKLTYDKVCTCYRACADTFPPINDALHAHFDLLRQTNLNVNELKCKFYVSIAEALEECPKYVKWMVPYIRRSVPAEVVEEKDDNSFSEVGINQDTEDDEVVEEATLPRVAAVSSPLMVYDTTTTTTTTTTAPSNTFLLDGNQDAAATTAVAATTSAVQRIESMLSGDTSLLDGNQDAAATAAATTSTVERIESMLSDVKGMSTVIEMTLNWPKIGNSIRRRPKTVEQSVCENYLLNASDLTNPQYSVITELIEHIKLIKEKSAEEGIPTIPTGETLTKKVAPKKKSTKAGTVQSKKKTGQSKKKPGIKKGTKLKRTKTQQVWFNGVHIYHHKYSHKKIKVTEFCRGNLSDERFTGSTSECNGFYKKYSAYKEGELKNPSGDDRSSTVAGATALQTQGTNGVFDFPSGDDSSMAATVRSSRRKRKRNNTGGSSNSQQKKKPYIPTKEDDASDPEWKLPSDGDDDDDDE